MKSQTEPQSQCQFNRYRRNPCVQAFVVACALLLSGAAGLAETLLSCTGLPGGDFYDRGFYLPTYPGNSLDSVRLEFSSTDTGNYSVTLTVRKNTYDGTVLAASTANFTITGTYPQNEPVTFVFPSTRIAKGSRICFSMSLDNAPGTTLYYSVPGFTGGCTSVGTDRRHQPAAEHVPAQRRQHHGHRSGHLDCRGRGIHSGRHQCGVAW